MTALPKGWALKPFAEIAVLQRGYDLPVQQRRAGNVPVFAANGTVGTHCEAKVAAPGVVTGRSGSIGKVHFVSSEFWPLNTALYVRDFCGNNPEWVAELLRWMHLERFARGGAVPTLNRNLVHAEIVPRPPLDAQRRIVGRIKGCMERVEEIERLRAEALAEAEAALPSTLSEIFDQLGAQYGSTTVEHVATETRYGTSKKCDSRAEGVPILRIPNVAGGVVDYRDLKYCRLDRSEFARIRLFDGDLLFVRTNGSRDLVGRCAVYRPRGPDDEFGFASYLIRVRLDVDLADPNYLKFFLNSTHGRDEIDRRRRTSAGQFNVNSENLRSIAFPCPPKKTQLAVIEQLAEQESLLVQLQAEIESAQAIESGLREAILRKAFTGEL